MSPAPPFRVHSIWFCPIRRFGPSKVIQGSQNPGCTPRFPGLLSSADATCSFLRHESRVQAARGEQAGAATAVGHKRSDWAQETPLSERLLHDSRLMIAMP